MKLVVRKQMVNKFCPYTPQVGVSAEYPEYILNGTLNAKLIGYIGVNQK